MPSSSTEPAPARRDPIGLVLVVVLLGTVLLLLLIEGSASVLMSLREARHTLNLSEEAHAQYDAELGWANRPGVHLPDLYGGGTPFTTNAQGLRATEDHAAAAPPGRYRAVLLGDSFTMGFGVGDDATYPAQMQGLCPTLQAINMGQGGYGLDQAYLWYRRDGAALNADLLVFAVIAHDFFRMVDDHFIGYAKPVLRDRGGTLSIENVPVPEVWQSRRLGRQAQAFVGSLATARLVQWGLGKLSGPPEDRFYGHVPDEVLAAAGLAFDDLAQRAQASGQRFVLVYLPTAEDLTHEGPTREAAWMADYARRTGVVFFNLMDEFSPLTAAQAGRLFRPIDGHYTPAGNRLVAEALLRRLAAQVPGFPDCGAATR